MSKMRPEYRAPDFSATHVLLRKEPDEEDEGEKDGEPGEDNEDDDEGYSP